MIGIHLEGPFISEREGYRGAHPEAAIRDPSWPLFEQLQEAAAGRIVLVTLAPERDGAIDFIRQATSAGVVIALGHTAGSESVIRDAAAAGARLSTHLGNGIAAPPARHPNPIWEQAALEALSASFIADGHHLDLATLRVLALAKGPGVRSWSATPARLPVCRPGATGNGQSSRRARSSSRAHRTWRARTRVSRSGSITCCMPPGGRSKKCWRP